MRFTEIESNEFLVMWNVDDARGGGKGLKGKRHKGTEAQRHRVTKGQSDKDPKFLST